MTLATHTLDLFNIHHPLCSTRNGRCNKDKNEVFSFFRSKVMEGSQNLKSRSSDAGHAHFGVIHHPLCNTRHGRTNKKNEVSSFIH